MTETFHFAADEFGLLARERCREHHERFGFTCTETHTTLGHTLVLVLECTPPERPTREVRLADFLNTR